MNKNIKRIIAITLTISAFSIIEPTKYMNLTNTIKASAEVRGADLKEISIEKGQIDFDSDDTDYTINVDSSVDEFKVKAVPREEDAEVRINGEEVTESDKYKRIVDLDRGENTITIKVKNGARNKTYTLTVIRGTVEDEQIYLSSISLSNVELNFSKETTSYDVNVNGDINEISIKAKPEDEDYDVEIDGFTAREDYNYKKIVSLENGKNEIKIKIEDDDDHEKVYTLNINRGGTSTATNSQTTTPTNTTAKGWSLNNGQWYYLNENGSKQTGWKAVNGSWYYLDTNGIMKTGWQSVNNEWYYLDSNGIMKTGWLKNSDNKWYYLYDSGVMAKNTTINGYKINSNGIFYN